MEKKYRSQNWFGKKGKDGFIYRAWMKNQGIPNHEFDGRPVKEAGMETPRNLPGTRLYSPLSNAC
jgi:hypothetical protein